MNHWNEESLALHYFGDAADGPEIERHLAACEECRALYRSIERTVRRLDALPIPERGEAYATAVWERLRPALPAPSGFRFRGQPWRWAAAGLACAAMLVLAFLAGRSYPPNRLPVQITGNTAMRERVLEVAVGDYLERSQRVLSELANARATHPLDITFEQQRAADLLRENRLYRQSALGAGDAVVAGVLDDLERVLLEIAHGPSRITPAELDDLRLRMEADGILFKIRVLGSNVRSRTEPATRQPL